jgi:MFS superfamily sulfate permease-like transporter
VGLASLAIVVGLRRVAPVVPGSLVAVYFGVLVFDTLPGLFIGIAVSLLLLLYRASRPNVADLGRVPGAKRHWGDVARYPDNVQVLRVESGFFFANADHVREAVEGHASGEGVHAVVLDAETVPFVDIIASRMLDELREDLAGQGITLLIARDIGQVCDVFRRSRHENTTEETAFATVEEAVGAATSLRSEHAASLGFPECAGGRAQ